MYLGFLHVHAPCLQIVHDEAIDAAGPTSSDDGHGPAPAEAASDGGRGSGGDSALAHGHAAPAPQLPRLSFYLDGAHTPESMAICAQWFADEVGADGDDGAPAPAPAGSEAAAAGKRTVQRVLLFNCMQVGECIPMVQAP